jgi:hypothetical protein
VESIDAGVEVRACPVVVQIVGVADGARPEACSGSIRRAPVERGSHDGDAGVAEVVYSPCRDSDEGPSGSERQDVEAGHEPRLPVDSEVRYRSPTE